MPIYAYKCESCGFAKDVLQKMSDPLLTDCPNCGKPTFTKQLTAAGFQLKGSGWYATDFKTQTPAPAAKGDSEPASGSDAASKAAPAAAPAASPAASPAPAAPAASAASAAAPSKTTPSSS